jgi:hypothetical protein
MAIYTIPTDIGDLTFKIWIDHQRNCFVTDIAFRIFELQRKGDK